MKRRRSIKAAAIATTVTAIVAPLQPCAYVKIKRKINFCGMANWWQKNCPCFGSQITTPKKLILNSVCHSVKTIKKRAIIRKKKVLKRFPS